MTDEQQSKKPIDGIPDKYKPVTNAGEYRGVIPGQLYTRDPKNRHRHVTRNQIAEGTDFDVFE